MSYVQVHQVWSYVNYKHKPEAVTVSENEPQIDKTRHVVQMSRIKKKIDLITLAKSVGTTPKALSQYEKGDDILSKEILEELFKLLEIPIKKQ